MNSLDFELTLGNVPVKGTFKYNPKDHKELLKMLRTIAKEAGITGKIKMSALEI